MTVDSRIAELGLAGLLTITFVFKAKPGWRLTFLFGAVAALAGADGLVTGSIGQKHNGGPPLEGPAAAVGSLFLLCLGLWFVWGAVKPSRNLESADFSDDKQTKTKDDPG